MNSWKHIPLLKYLIPFILGILVATNNLIPFWWVIFFIGLTLSTTLIIHFSLNSKINFTLIKVGSFLTFCLIFILGILYTHFFIDKNYSNHISNHLSSKWYKVKVIDQPKVKEKVVSCRVSVLNSDNKELAIQGKVQIYIVKDTLSSEIQYGDYLIIKNKLQEIKAPENQYQFNFKKFYGNQNIYHQAFLNNDQWLSLNQNEPNGLIRLGHIWQLKLRLLFKDYFKNEAVRGVAQAVIFGFKEDLDDEWLRAFSKTGTIHVLAVSGLHVGIIYVLMSFLLGVSTSKGPSLVFKSMLMILALFLYALLTGFSPSVSRASIMFGTVIIGKSLNRQSSIYNTLCLACFVLLMKNPLNIYNVGFQFSFLAVLGIVYFKDDIRSMFPEGSYFSDKVYVLMSVSIAAQITTFPLGIYYFHQYPNLFMFSNLIVIPCISMVLYFGVAFIFLVQVSSVLGKIIADVITIYIQFIANAVNKIQHIPYAFFEGIYILPVQLATLYILIILVSITTKYKWKSGILFSALFVLIFIINDFLYTIKINNTEVICFDVKKEVLIGFKKGNHITFLVSKNLIKNERIIEYMVKPYLIANRLDENYSFYPVSLKDSKVNLKNVKLLGNGIFWFDEKAYQIRDNDKVICVFEK